MDNEEMLKRARAVGATYLEWDEDRIVGYGSDEDYDRHAVEVQNGEGYYDASGRFRSFYDGGDSNEW